MSTQTAFHGSDLELIEQRYGIAKESILSFSANVNPLGLSPQFRSSLAQHLDAVLAYPDRDYIRLRQAIAAYSGVPVEHLLVGSGATELISLFISSIAPRKAMLLNPTYSEYARKLELEGGAIVSYQLRPEAEFQLDVEELCSVLDESFDLLILCNPNNPTGTALTHAQLRPLLAHCQDKGIYVMIDETYVEFAARLEQITAVVLTSEFKNLFVLRGVSKFFAAPGLRLGYCVVGDATLYARMARNKDPWSVNALAATAGAQMFLDETFISHTHTFVQQEMGRLLDRLRTNRALHVYEPTANFVLLRLLSPTHTSFQAFEYAIKRGLMIRDCASFPGLGEKHIRFCLHTSENNDRLMDVLEEYLTDC